MTREEFKTVVKAFSFYKIDKRKGDYSCPNGQRLSSYLTHLICKLLTNNSLAIASNGNVYKILNGKAFIPFGTDEETCQSQQETRAAYLANEMLGNN